MAAQSILLARALSLLGYTPPNLPVPSQGDATGLLIQELMPESYPAIMQQVYVEGSSATATNSNLTFNVPSDVDRLLGFAVFSATSSASEASFSDGVTITININQDIVVKAVPMATFITWRNGSSMLPFVAIGRKVKVGDNVTLNMSASAAAVNVIWVAVYQKAGRALI